MIFFKATKLLFLTVIYNFFSPFVFPVFAQIKPDNTLGTENSKINSINELRDRIEGGAIRDNNLFHSFENFNVNEGLEVYFANPEAINNIFSRVTGNNISEIFGKLGVEGTANLFLINPNGIVFGKNAVIDVGGSFMATTAESIGFNNGDEFSAVKPNDFVRLRLTLDLPTSYNFGDRAGEIVAEGLKNGVLIEIPGFNSIEKNKSKTLTGAPEQTFSLIAQGITFKGGGITAEGGRIELGSVAGHQTVSLSPTDRGQWITSYENVTEFQDIKLLEAAKLDTTGDEAGAISIFGRDIVLDTSSVILANTIKSSTDSLNSLSINASGLLKLQGNLDINSNSVSFISADVLPTASGNGIEIDINAQKLQLFDGAEIRAVNFSDNSNSFTGKISIDAEQIELAGVKLGEVPTTRDVGDATGGLNSLITNTTGIGSEGGNANDIQITTETLKVIDGAGIKADSFTTGEGGNLIIEAIDLELRGINPFLQQRVSGLSASLPINAETANNKGNIFINAENISVLNGAKIITTNPTVNGAAGNINIVAKNIDLIGFADSNLAIVSGIFSSIGNSSIGESGNINIQTHSLNILNGARIQADSQETGNSGNITIQATEINLDGTRPARGSLVGGITASSNSRSLGDGALVTS